MNRNYTTGEQDNAVFFLGKEVEKTPAYGMKTLFVVGLREVEAIEKLLSDPFLSFDEPVKHIFFGANHSFKPSNYNEWRLWDDMIENFLLKDYFCSLDIPLSHAEEFLDGGLCEHDNFIPQIRVPLPYISLWNYNTMIKIDDKGFKKSNPGIWTHSLHDLMDRNKFTDWTAYKNDEIIK